MVSARVVSMLMVCGVVSVSGRALDQGSRPGAHYVRATASTSFIPFTTPRPQHNTSSPAEQKKQPPLQRRIDYNQEDVYPLLIPVKFGVNPELVYSEQHGRSYQEPSEIPRAALSSPPRLIMDKDFNIRFDNPYIMPVSKPLAFVLDSSVAGRSMAGAKYNKMMIPVPVLVQARSPLPEDEGYRGPGDHRRPGERREPGEHVEHRTNDDEEFFPGESFGRHPPRKLGRSRKPWKNNTATYKENTSLKSGRTMNDPVEEDDFESAEGPSVYPSKIFEDMYRRMPKFPVDSRESRERERAYDDTRRKYSRSKEATTQERPRTRSMYTRQPVYSATRGLEWVAHPSTPAPEAVDKKSGRGVDKVGGRVTSTTTNPLQPPTEELFLQPTTAPPPVHTSQHSWIDV